MPYYFYFLFSHPLNSQRWVQRPCNNMFLLFSFSCCLLHLVPWHFSPDEVHEPGMWQDFQILILALMCGPSIYVCACEWDIGREETRPTSTVLLTSYHLTMCPSLNALHLTAILILCWLFCLHPHSFSRHLFCTILY